MKKKFLEPVVWRERHSGNVLAGFGTADEFHHFLLDIEARDLVS